MKTFERTDREKGKYGVTYMLEGNRKRKFFHTKTARDAWIAAHHLTGAVDDFSLTEWLRWKTVKMRSKQLGIEVEQLIERYEREQVISRTLVGDAVSRFLEEQERHASPEYYAHLKHTLEDQVAVLFHGHTVNQVKTEDLRLWLNGQGYAPVTVKNKLAYIKAFFRWCIREELLDTDPTARIRAPRIINAEIGILTPAQGEALFKYALSISIEFAARLACQAFAGMRTSNAFRLDKQEINFQNRQILIPAAKFKTGRRHLIENCPGNLWAWLEPAKDEAWTMGRRRYYRYLEKAYAGAGIVPPKNALRHSFATYKCAVDGEAAKASYILGHSNPREIWQSYKGVAGKSGANRWFRIRP